MENNGKVHVIGGGLAGCEAAWQIARAGVPVSLYEMRPNKLTDVHQTALLGELVCSNSFRSDDAEKNAVGLLHEEMRRCGSLILKIADSNKVPAGGALAVDREGFARGITDAIESEPKIELNRNEVRWKEVSTWKNVIIATGPLTSSGLASDIAKITGENSLAFFDAISPIIYADSVDFTKAWYQSRYDKVGPVGTGKDYINCAMNKAQYHDFINHLELAKKTEFKQWEKETPYFEGCLPIEVMASRGAETLRFGPMKPVGLSNPHLSEKAYAVVQLRQDNSLATLYNIVGFQTKLTYEEQTRIFRMIPGLENGRFARLGGIHRNTFINSPRLLDEQLRLRLKPCIRFAGQITGVEGYVESAAVGLIVGCLAAADAKNLNFPLPPATTALGALLIHVTEGAMAETFQPMNINFGLLPPMETRLKRAERKKAFTSRALKNLQAWQETLSFLPKGFLGN